MIRARASDALKATSRYFNIPVDELIRGKGHMRKVRARWAGMYVARELTSQSYPQIARTFGRTNHTTVIWGVRRLQKALGHSESARIAIDSVREGAVSIALKRFMSMQPILLPHLPPQGGEHAAHN